MQRFTDWKYATRTKYRKKCEHRSQTGSGPQSNIVLSELEERALSAWGKVVVTGNTDVTQYEGLELPSNINTNETNMEDITANNTETNIVQQKENILTYNLNDAIILTDDNIENILNKNISGKSSALNIQAVLNKETPETPKSACTTTSKNRYSYPRVKPLSILTEKLLESNTDSTKTISEFNNIFKTFTENYINLKKEKLEHKKCKLKFKIEKFKLLHPELKSTSIDKNV